jgi:aspartate carbamoyltransferase catalytic subunit
MSTTQLRHHGICAPSASFQICKGHDSHHLEAEHDHKTNAMQKEVRTLPLTNNKMSTTDNNNNDDNILAPLVDTLTSDPASWKGSSLLSVTQITPSGLALLLQTVKAMKTLVRTDGGDDRLKHRVLATVFYEASTRTSSSFQAAMQRLGGTIIHMDGKGNNSANKKGETLQDTIRCLECYVDLTVLRHSVKGSVAQIMTGTSKPVLNAGDGTGEHPTQALLDLYTICDELKYDMTTASSTENKKLVVVLLGDLKHGRTVHSLSKLLARSGIKVVLRYCAPPELPMPDYIQDYVASYSHVTQECVSDLTEAVQGADVLYVTRVQKERFETVEEYEAVKVRLLLVVLGVTTITQGGRHDDDLMYTHTCMSLYSI